MKKLYISFAALCAVFSASAQFTGSYAPSNWNTVLLAGSNGSVNTSGAPASIIITGSNNVSGSPSSAAVNTDLVITATTSGVWRFSWAYHTNDSDNDPQYDLAGILINGVFTQLTSNTGGVNQSGTFTAPNVTVGTVIGFRISATDNVFGNATFTISSFSAPGSTLPLTLTNFTAKPQGEAVQLQWTTQEESRISSFVIERSADGNSFTTVTSVASANAQGQQTYSAVDASPLSGTSYYRLRIKEQTGGERLSAIAVVKRSNLLNIQVYPNPVKGDVRLTVTSTKTGNETIKLLDASGRTIYSKTYALTTGQHTINLDAALLTPGVYYVATQDKVVSFIKE